MVWLIDGSNVLGAMRLDLTSVSSKRELARLSAAFARDRRSHVTCYFDGSEPHSFAKHLGNATIVFSGERTADDLIAQRVEGSDRKLTVVTSDRQLAARVSRRRVNVITAQQFVAELRSIETEHGEAASDDWAAYFSDPKNRQDF